MNNANYKHQQLYRKRIFGLDVFRGWALVLMMIFHLSYYLAYFGLAQIDIIHGTFWVYFRYLIVSIFTISVGVSLGIVHTPKIRWNKVLHRALILGSAATMVTIATRIQAPHSWVYFGILHFIFVASLVGLLFINFPRLSLVGAIVIFIISALGISHQEAIFYYLQPIFNLPNTTEDLARFFPWFGAVLVGIGVYGLGWHKWLFALPLFSSQNRYNQIIAFLGRHSLLVYLIHAPVLFGIVYLISRLL